MERLSLRLNGEVGIGTIIHYCKVEAGIGTIIHYCKVEAGIGTIIHYRKNTMKSMK